MLPRGRRAIMVWGLVGSGALVLVLAAGLACWFELPRWAPDWVIEHSPFVEPVVRARAEVRRPSGTPASEGGFPGGIEDLSGLTLTRFGTAAEPVLRRLVGDGDIAVRLQAFRFHGGFSASELHQLTGDADPWMRLAAWQRLRNQPLAVRYLPPAAFSAADGAPPCALDLLDDADDYIREDVQHALGLEGCCPGPCDVRCSSGWSGPGSATS
jgi:hypothetical protein